MYPESQPRIEHINLVSSYRGLALALLAVREFREAEEYQVRGLRLAERLYSPDRYPHGHLAVAMCRNSLGAMKLRSGQYDEAEELLLKSLKTTLHFADGQPDSAAALVLDSVRALYDRQQKYGKGLSYAQRTLAMREKIFSTKKYPNGHPWVALGLNNVGGALERLKRFDDAREYFVNAKEMSERLYDRDAYPDSHEDVFAVVQNLARVELRLGNYEAARLNYAEATRTRFRLSEYHISGVSEAKGFEYLMAGRPRDTVGLLLSAWSYTPAPVDELYDLLWTRRSLIGRAISHRLQLVRDSDSEAVRSKYDEYRSVRLELSKLTWEPRPGNPHDAAVLTAELKITADRKETLESELADLLPAMKRRIQESRIRPADLKSALAADAAFVDFLRYQHLHPVTRQLSTAYTAFVVRSGKPVVQVRFADADRIDRLVEAWRGDIQQWAARSKSGDELYAALWQPLEPHLKSVRQIYICPDAKLTAVPWGALPTDRRHVLLERHSIATVPYGQLLARHLPSTHQSPASASAERLLSVGDLDYGTGSGLQQLPHTATELRTLATAAAPRPVVTLRKKEAVLSRVVQELRTVRYAHFATHGYFQDVQSTRSPLVLSGLYLSGGSRFSGEAIAAEPLTGLRLVVLSACDTGLGRVADGEGVLGLQRAFHMAGCQNIVASLWPVHDEVTAKLMEKFYQQLFRNGRSPAEALRAAQLEMRKEKFIFQRTDDRGPGRPPTAALTADEMPPRLWAGFVLSGSGL